MNPCFSNIENYFTELFPGNYEDHQRGRDSNSRVNNFRNIVMGNSNSNNLNDCSLNGSVPFYDDNNFINKTIERPKFYQHNKENSGLANILPNIRQKKAKKANKNKNYCVFCYNNNEPEENYSSHIVRNEYDIVICPKLRLYTCPICNETGDNAHTVKYCPRKKIVTLEETVIMENYRNTFKKYNQRSIYA